MTSLHSFVVPSASRRRVPKPSTGAADRAA